MRTVIYARKSTERDERQAHSLEDQIKYMRAVAKREGLNVLLTFQESKSAKEPGTRPEFAKMVEMIRTGQIDVILAWHANRLSRNEVDGGWLSYLLQTGALKLIRTPERAYRPEDSSILFTIDNAQSTDYVRNLKKDVARGMREKAERGWHTSKAPLGYINDAETRQIIPDPHRFARLREAWDLLLTGEHSVSEIHRRLVAEGLSVKVRSQSGYKPISHSRLYEVFHSRTYVGEVPFKGRYLPGKHVPMVTEEEFDRAQAIMGRFGKSKKSEPNRLPFAGLFRCENCGCAIVGETKRKVYPKTKRVAVYTYYHCSGSKGCSKTAVRQEDLVEAAFRTVASLRLTQGTASWLKESIFASLEGEALGTTETMAELARRNEAEDMRLQRLSRMRLEGEIEGGEYLKLKNEIVERQASIRQSINDGRDQAGRVLRLLHKKLDCCVAAGELENLDNDPRILAKVLRIAGSCLLNLERFDFRIDPILSKIAAFEPLKDSSEKPERGDAALLFPVWWTLVEDLRNLATEALVCEDSRRASMTYQARRYWRENGWDLD